MERQKTAAATQRKISSIDDQQGGSHATHTVLYFEEAQGLASNALWDRDASRVMRKSRVRQLSIHPSNYVDIKLLGKNLSRSDILESAILSNTKANQSEGLTLFAAQDPKKVYIMAIRWAAAWDPANK